MIPNISKNLVAYVPSDLVPFVVGNISASSDRVLKNVDTPVTDSGLDAFCGPFTDVVEFNSVISFTVRAVADALFTAS